MQKSRWKKIVLMLSIVLAFMFFLNIRFGLLILEKDKYYNASRVVEKNYVIDKMYVEREMSDIRLDNILLFDIQLKDTLPLSNYTDNLSKLILRSNSKTCSMCLDPVFKTIDSIIGIENCILITSYEDHKDALSQKIESGNSLYTLNTLKSFGFPLVNDNLFLFVVDSANTSKSVYFPVRSEQKENIRYLDFIKNKYFVD